MANKPSQILPYLFLGGKNEAKSKSTLLQLKISYILNCTPSRNNDPESGCPNYYEKEKSFKYCRIPIYDNKGEDITNYIDTANRFIEEGKHYGGVLVHCHKGISRSASFVICYLMKKNQMTCDEALCYVQGIRSIVTPNVAFMTQLRLYDMELTLQRNHTETEVNLNSHCNFENPSSLSCIGPSIGPIFNDDQCAGAVTVEVSSEQNSEPSSDELKIDIKIFVHEYDQKFKKQKIFEEEGHLADRFMCDPKV